MKIRNKKVKKSKGKKEDLPSFLLNLKEIPEDLTLPPRKKKSTSYLGPIFLGECLQFHPPHHSVPLNSFHHIHFPAPSDENGLDDLFLPEPAKEEKYLESKSFHPFIKQKTEFIDPYPHKCPGFRRTVACDRWVFEGLGETKSIIEGETSREIPFCRVRKASLDCCRITTKEHLEIVTLSDIREENRISMSYKERMAHSHFPKEFVTVRIVGPPIPEAFTITKVPSKRPSVYEIDAHLKSKSKKTKTEEKGKSKESTKEKIAEPEEKKLEPERSFVVPLMITESNIEEKADSDSNKEQAGDVEERDDLPQSKVSIGNAEGEKREDGSSLAEESDEKTNTERKSVVLADGEVKSSLDVVEEENPPENEEN